MNPLRIVGTLALIVITLTSTAAMAQSSKSGAHKAWLRADAQPRSSAGVVSSHGTVSKSIALVVIAAGAGYFFWRKRSKKGELNLPNRPHVRVLSGTIVGPKARAVVAEVGGRFILLGVTEQSVRRLAWLDSFEENAREDEPRNIESQRLEEDSKVKANASPRAKVPTATLVASRSEPRSPRFSDVLRDAVGIKSKTLEEPAVVLAESTRDQLTLSAASENLLEASDYVNVEGQAAGLVSRLNRKK